jgi:hypothetical protein
VTQGFRIPHHDAEERRFLPGLSVQNTARAHAYRRDTGFRIPQQHAEAGRLLPDTPSGQKRTSRVPARHRFLYSAAGSGRRPFDAGQQRPEY